MKKTLIAIALILGSQPMFAEPEENLYQVEVIIFERSSRQDSNDVEVWPKLIELNYPEVWQRLLSPSEAKRLSQSNLTQSEDDFSLSQDFLQSLGDSPNKSADSPTNNLDSIDKSSAQQTENTVAYFQFLGENKKSLNAERKALDRTGHLRTIFHETWLQPMQDSKNAPALVLKGGEQFGEHAELEGYITLSIARYLHIQTNLWFTQFIPNYGQESEHWPPLPKFPKPASSQESLTLGEMEDNSLFNRDSDGPSLLQRYSEQEPEQTPSDLIGSNSVGDILDAPYIIKETVVMDQKRRMRSRELHYIDHPRMGLLIRFLPVVSDEKSEG